MKDYSQRKTIKKYTRFRSPSTFRVRKNIKNIKNKVYKLVKGQKDYD